MLKQILLKPTVKRDLSLFSVQAWQKGYLESFKNKFGWSYPIIFYYDGVKVNFYNRADDFKYFKEVITEKLLLDDELFRSLNQEFLENVQELNSIQKITVENFQKIFNLIAKVMSFYIFVVSDAFVKRRPEAWASRQVSEGVLYGLDLHLEAFLKKNLEAKNFDSCLAHVMSCDEVVSLINNQDLNTNLIKERCPGYVIDSDTVTTNADFREYCQKNNFINPEETQIADSNLELRGDVVYQGRVVGQVRVVSNIKDISRVEKGDIFVSIMTNTNYTPAIKNAAAIVTDEGGITCHAAIIARELKKPCVVGTKKATSVLHDGDLVEVDAEKGRVILLKAGLKQT